MRRQDLSTVLIGGRDIGEALVDDTPCSARLGHRARRAMGRSVGPTVAARFGAIDSGARRQQRRHRHARPPIWISTLRAIAFAAMGTAGQRCTTLRRLFVHDSICDALRRVALEDDLRFSRRSATRAVRRRADRTTAIDKAAFDAMQRALSEARAAGLAGHRRRARGCRRRQATHSMCRPALVEAARRPRSVQQETFATILYVMPYQNSRRSD